MKIDHFASKAAVYEQNPARVDNVENIANAILNTISINKSMHIMDFGSGTGLLLERIAPHVAKISAVDVSIAMNAQLRAKEGSLGCEIEIIEIDLEKSDLNVKFDGIISSMTMHHIQNIDAMFVKFHAMLKDGGFIALADLESEDGSFHTENTGVHHFGFDKDAFAKSASAANFQKIKIQSASAIQKSYGNFPVFLLTAIR